MSTGDCLLSSVHRPDRVPRGEEGQGDRQEAFPVHRVPHQTPGPGGSLESNANCKCSFVL